MRARIGVLFGSWLWAAGHAIGAAGAAAPPAAGPEVEAVRLLSSAELAMRLAQREEELRALKARVEELEALDDHKWYAEARTLGLVAELSRHGFTDRQLRRVAAAIVREARANGLSPLLVMAVIRCESAFNPYAVSGPGAMGLMQVMPGTGKWLATQRGSSLGKPRNLFDIELNIELGTAYLASLLSQFGNLEHALVAYNAGPGAAKKILADRKKRRRFIAGYPRKVVLELKRLEAKVAAAQSVAESPASSSPP